MAQNLKDRSNKLPQGHFAVSYDMIERCLGRESLTREAAPQRLATAEQVARIRHFVTVSGMKEEKLRERLAAYGAASLEALTEPNAQLIITKFEGAAVNAAQNPVQ